MIPLLYRSLTSMMGLAFGDMEAGQCWREHRAGTASRLGALRVNWHSVRVRNIPLFGSRLPSGNKRSQALVLPYDAYTVLCAGLFEAVGILPMPIRL